MLSPLFGTCIVTLSVVSSLPVGLKQPGRTAELKVEPSGIVILVRVEIRIWDQKSRDVDIVMWDDDDI